MCASTGPSDPPAGADPAPILSRRNPAVRLLRELHDVRGRRRRNRLLLEGTHLLQEALRLGLRPDLVLATEAWRRRHPQLTASLAEDVPVRTASEEVLAHAATTRHPDGVLCSLPPPPVRARPSASFVLALERIQDPGNLGTLLRTALAGGVEAVWLADGADPLQPKVLRASSGAGLALPPERMEAAALAERLEQARATGAQVVAAVVPGAERSLPYWHLDWTRPTVLLLGNEGAGLDPTLRARADRLVTIPHAPAVESLNVAVAAAPLLLERWRQRAEPNAAR